MTEQKRSQTTSRHGKKIRSQPQQASEKKTPKEKAPPLSLVSSGTFIIFGIRNFLEITGFLSPFTVPAENYPVISTTFTVHRQYLPMPEQDRCWAVGMKTGGYILLRLPRL